MKHQVRGRGGDGDQSDEAAAINAEAITAEVINAVSEAKLSGAGGDAIRACVSMGCGVEVPAMVQLRTGRLQTLKECCGATWTAGFAAEWDTMWVSGLWNGDELATLNNSCDAMEVNINMTKEIKYELNGNVWLVQPYAEMHLDFWTSWWIRSLSPWRTWTSRTCRWQWRKPSKMA